MEVWMFRGFLCWLNECWELGEVWKRASVCLCSSHVCAGRTLTVGGAAQRDLAMPSRGNASAGVCGNTGFDECLERSRRNS
ncbi:unnamed protein product [Protopolystoma xenopodis]|uniref:Uncharacterized protein n=1 Tax=Protopolystoma xenopodis TaxID=117903 RepID=A0A3S5A435_9PLAT|nr:unnamed protein product [Protopolystoma xenopodis]